MSRPEPDRVDSRLFDSPASNEKIYSVPRRFGIGTTMGVATACAVFVWLLKALGASPLDVGFFAAFLLIVGVMQAIFQTTPRWISFITGSVLSALWVVVVSVFWIATSPYGPTVGEFFCMVVAALILGGGAGYVGGALVASIFMVMDYFSQWVQRLREGRNK